MTAPRSTLALDAHSAPERTRPSNYPEAFAALVQGRIKRPLGDLFGLANFGVNLIELPPGCVSALHHVHSHQDEFIYVLQGQPTLFIGDQQVELAPGMVAGLPANGLAHHVENRSRQPCVLLEVGDRSAGDTVAYPLDDIQAVRGEEGAWRFTHKDGSEYD